VDFALTRERTAIALRIFTIRQAIFFLGTAHRDGAAARFRHFAPTSFVFQKPNLP
jgi:hypothetical protein